MSFKPSEILATLSKNGVAKSSHFEVQITGPGATGEENDLMLRADSCELLGRTISTSEYRVYGPIRKIAYASTYTDTSIGFLCSADLREKRYFEEWQDIIMNHRATKGMSAKQTRGRYEVGYYENYVRTIEIRQYDESGTKQSAHFLDEAYPIGIAPITMTWAGEELIRLQVTFAFHDYRADFSPGPANPDAKPAGPSISGSIKIGDFTAGGNIPLPSSVTDVTNRAVSAIRRRF